MPKQVNCSELAATLTKIAMNLGSRPEIKDFDGVVAEMIKNMPELTRQAIVDNINEATTGQRQALDELSKKLATIKRQARSEKQIQKTIAKLEEHLRSETLPEPKRKPGQPTETVSELKELKKQLDSALRRSDPAVKKRLIQQIEDLTERLETGDFIPPIKNATKLSREAERLQYQKNRIRRQIEDKIRQLKPKSITERLAEPTNTVRAVLTSFDVSAPGRQGILISAAHPIRALKSLGPMLRAFSSEKYAMKVYEEIMNRENAPLYAKSGLYIAPIGQATKLTAREEAYMTSWAEKIPFIKSSERAYITFLNKLRADSFDAVYDTLIKKGGNEDTNIPILSNYINAASGRGNLGKLESSANLLNIVFFSPKYQASRLQMLSGQPLWGGPWKDTGAARKIIATEYARTIIGLGTLLGLGLLAGGEIEDDPRSSDFGKLRFGKTRLDLLAGLSQYIVFASRLATGETKSLKSGKITPIRGKVPYGRDNAADVIWRFLRTKFSPAVSTPIDLLSKKDVTGKEITYKNLPEKLLFPIAWQDVYDAMKEHGLEQGTIFSLLTLFGVGAQTFDENKKISRN